MSTDEPTIKLVRPIADPSVVELLAALLEKAKDGRLQFAVIYVKTPEHCYNIYRAGRGSYTEDIGAIELLKSTLARWSDEEAVPELNLGA